MGSNDDKCIFIDAQYNVHVHVYQKSDENDFMILYARRGNLCKQLILSGCFKRQSFVYFVFEINKLNQIHV